MTNWEKVITEIDMDGVKLRFCKGEDYVDPINNEPYYFIERDLTIPDLAKMIKSKKCTVKLPDHVLGNLTGCARMWLTHSSGWALEYKEEGETEAGYWQL